MLSLFLARRIYRQGGTTTATPAVKIATAGVAIGLAVMIVTLSVILGFKHTVADKVTGMGGHIQVADFATLQTGDTQPICIDDSMMRALRAIPHVAHVQRFATVQGILKTHSDFLGVIFRGIAQEYDTTFLARHLTAGHIPTLSDTQPSRQLLLSATIADRLSLNVGSSVRAYFFDGTQLRARPFRVAAIYQTHLAQYDDAICITDLHTVRRLAGYQTDQAAGAELTLDHYSLLPQVSTDIVDRIHRTTDHYGHTYSSRTIEELYPQIFQWLSLLDVNVYIIIALMAALAAITIVSGILIIILSRTQMIGLLRALGMRPATVRHIFLCQSLFIVLRGLAIGYTIAIALLLVQRHTSLVSLDPATYYVSAVPVEIHIPLFIAIGLATLTLCMLATLIPCALIARIHPARTIKYQ